MRRSIGSLDAFGVMIEMENPFRYGSVVTGDDFVDREKELKLLANDLRNRQRVLLFSDRRMGKSSLLKELARRNRREFIFAHVDLYGIASTDKFLESVLAGVTGAAYSNFDKFAATVSEFIRGLRVRFVITREGLAGIEVDQKDFTNNELQQVIDFPEKLAKKKGRPVVVILDEFQEVLAFGGVPLTKLIRSRMQFHQNATYIFSGSKRHLLTQIFMEEEGAFYKSARPLELGPIPAPEFEQFIIRKFKSSGGSIDRALARRIIDASFGYPYYVQQIAHELFDVTNEPTSAGEVDAAVIQTVNHQAPAFQVWWDSIKSPLQRQYLLAVAGEPKVAHGTDFIVRHGLKSYSHVQRIESQLQAKGLIEAGEVADPMFALWLRNLSLYP